MYKYYYQSKKYSDTLNDGKNIIIPGTSSICTDVIDSYLQSINANRRMLTDLFVLGRCSTLDISVELISLSLSSDMTAVTANYDGEYISESMIYLYQDASNPFGRSLITNALKHAYKQECYSNYFENRIIKEIGDNQKYLLGVSQTLGISQDEAQAESLMGITAISSDETNLSPKIGKFQNQSVSELVEATRYKRQDILPSHAQRKLVRDDVVELLRSHKVECEPVMILDDEIFKIAEGIMMLTSVEGVITPDEIRRAIF